MRHQTSYSSMNMQQLIKEMDARGLQKPPHAGRIYGVAYMTEQEKEVRSQIIESLIDDDRQHQSKLLPFLKWLIPIVLALIALYFQISR